MNCPHSSDWTQRVSRTWLQKIFYCEVYLCTGCGARSGYHHRLISTVFVNSFRFIFARHSHCVSCGSTAVSRSPRAWCLSKNPLGWIQWVVGAPVMECSPCNRQYFDWRSVRPRQITVTPPILAALRSCCSESSYSKGRFRIRT
jgi:hypothetical protein